MSLKHTPGPWYVGAMNDALFILKLPPSPNGADAPIDTPHPGQLVIAKPAELEFEVTKANANLIAAAPTLLDSLKRADEALRFHPNGDNRSGADRILADLIIARAEGRNA